MSKKNYGFAYDYSNMSPIHKFINSSNVEVCIYKDFNSYAIVQKDSKGHQQRLKVDEVGLNKMLQMFDKHKWKELNV